MQNTTKKTLQIYWKHTKRRKIPVVLFFLFVIISSTLSLIPPIFLKDFFNILSNGDVSQSAHLITLLGIIIGLSLTNWLFRRAEELTSNVYKNYIMVDISQTAFAYLHGHSVSFFNDNFVGSLVKKVKRFIAGYDRLGSILAWDLTPILVTIIFVFTVLVRTNVFFGVAVIIYAIVMIGFNLIFSKYKLKYDEQRTAAQSRWTGHIADTITNHINVKFFNGKKRELAKYTEIENDVRRLNTFTWQLGDLNQAGQSLIIIFLEMALFFWAIHLWKQGNISVGDFILIQAYVIELAHRFWGIGRVIRDFYESIADANEMTEILMLPHEIIEKKNATALTVEKPEIIFDHVSFHYNKTRKVINDITLTIKAKESIALVGPSGAGKSTIIKLLMRMHDTTKGKIMISGQKINNVTTESLWENISYVPQSPILFHRTLLDNISYGRPDATQKEIMAAAKAAYCDEFIEQFPDKYETLVGERGVKLSGGERQRIAIGRAILRNAPILILDEATSSLDSRSEQLIQEALKTLMKDKTVIVIAHRLSTIMKMDRIIVIEHGMITEQGTHKQLLKKKTGAYHKLWELQV